MTDARAYPERPILAVSAAIIRDGRILIVRRAMPPAEGFYTLPGGVVEKGETLADAVRREVNEETALAIEPLGITGHRDVIIRDAAGAVARHFVIVVFACRWIAGEPAINGELTEAKWLLPADLKDLKTTEGLEDIVAAAFGHPKTYP